MTKLPVTQVDSTVLPVSFFDETPSDSRGAFLWDDPDQDQCSEITQIMVD